MMNKKKGILYIQGRSTITYKKVNAKEGVKFDEK